MATHRRAHLLLTVTILLLLCRLTRATLPPSPSPSPSSSNDTAPSAAPSPPMLPKLPRGLPRLIPAWSLPVNPFTAKAAFIRYWNRKVRSTRPHPAFFFAKLSPLSAPDATAFSTLASAGKLASRIHDFCAAASLLCPSTPAASWSASSSTTVEGAAAAGASGGSGGGSAPFKDYENGNFSSYGNSGGGGADQFALYSRAKSNPVDSFRRYGKGSLGRNDSFTSYEAENNIGTSSFSSYTTGATGGAGEFAAYAGQTNTVAATFATYDAAGNGRSREFAAYAQDANSGVETFTSYGKAANGGAGESFKAYGNHSNTVASGFINYGEKANGFNDTFANYGLDGNAPENTFRSYASGSNAGADEFKAYRDNANVGDDSFSSYASNANGAAADFDSYGKSVNPGSVAFKGYGQGVNPNHRIGFTHYAGDNTSFKAYSNEGVEFKEYQNMSKMEVSKTAVDVSEHHRLPKSWSPEPGKFFRERDLMMGNRMPMPDIADKTPPRAFLPRDIAAKIPFQTEAVSSLFGAPSGTAMGQAVSSTVAECARPPSRGETKRCATSAEDMLDFAVEMLGSGNIAVRATESTAGGGGDVRLGRVAGVAGGSVTRSVSCHQSLFPYLVYYCHSVPRVRLYEADILDVDTNRKINHGVAICHLDTSDWSPNHGAFIALGGKPGDIEVCHWIFQGDMTWTLAD
ncbi:hypothetical protein EJB05_53695, partial [Eragrostis curvula]